MRLAGRILLELRKVTQKPCAFFSDLLDPLCFDNLVLAVKNVCLAAEKRSMKGALQFEKPALALKAGQAIKKLICLKEGWAIRHRDLEAKAQAEDLLKLYHREWCDKVNALAFQTLRERKLNNPELLPLTEDLAKLKKYQISEMNSLTERMNAKPSSELWRRLGLTTLGRISVFNKRREAEVGELPLSVYLKSKMMQNANTDLMQGLSHFEKSLCDRLHHIEVIGKQNRKVPIVLTQDMVDALDTLVNFRQYAKSQADNPYLFANAGSSHLKTSEALNVATSEAGLLRPEWITSTKLRKYMATVSQVVSLSENELEYLANHMGHNIMVHRNFYRLQDSTVELAKVSKLLLAAEEGKMGSLAGKSLDEIDFNDLPDHTENTDADLPDDMINTQPDEDGHSVEKRSEMNQEEQEELEDGHSVENMSEMNQEELEEIDDGDIRALVNRANRHARTSQKVIIRTCWTSAEMEAIAGLVERSVVEKKPPTKNSVSACLSENPVLKDRKWKTIKFRVWAEAQKILKKREKVKATLLSE